MYKQSNASLENIKEVHIEKGTYFIVDNNDGNEKMQIFHSNPMHFKFKDKIKKMEGYQTLLDAHIIKE